MKKYSALLLSVLLGLCTAMPTFAIDITDVEPPRILSLKKLQDLPSRGNVVIYELNVIDEKSNFRLVYGGGFTEFVFEEIQKRYIAPICGGGETRVSSQIQVVPTTTESIKSASGSNQIKMFVIIYLKKPSELPQGCPNPINSILSRSAIEFLLIDEAGNQLKFLLPIESIKLESINDDQSYCYYPPYPNQPNRVNLGGSEGTVSYREWFDIELRYWNKFVLNFAGTSKAAQDYLLRFLAEKPKLKTAIDYPYLENSAGGFDLRQFNSFPLCSGNQANELQQVARFTPLQFSPVWVVPWFTDINGWQEASRNARAIFDQENEVEQKAKQELQVKAAMDKATAERKAKQESEAAALAAAAKNKKTTITCVKGKLTKKVTAVKPKCPAGYKVKK